VNRKAHAYRAINERPLVLCAWGNTPSQAMRKLATIIKDVMEDYPHSLVLGLSTHYDDDFVFHITATLSLSVLGE
jgi:hypothetical protein